MKEELPGDQEDELPGDQGEALQVGRENGTYGRINWDNLEQDAQINWNQLDSFFKG